MIDKIPLFLNHLVLGNDGIFGSANFSASQATEHNFREDLARSQPRDYLREVSNHHSIQVMDREVERFISQVPNGGVVCDVGGCWGWHWRRLQNVRPDINIVIIDFVRSNLRFARKVLAKESGSSVYFVHGDATSLEFPDNTFDGYWSVQTLQHIPDLRKALFEAKRVLRPSGVFSDYSLNNCFFSRLIFLIFGNKYVVEGMVENSFFLRRLTDDTLKIYDEFFSTQTEIRYTEIVFKPELRFTISGRHDSFLGKIDSMLSNSGGALRLFARQRSIHAVVS